MTNEYIELVKKWAAGEVFSQQELDANSDAAYAARSAARSAAAKAAADAAANAAAFASYSSAYADDSTEYAAEAHSWVKRYEELSNAK